MALLATPFKDRRNPPPQGHTLNMGPLLSNIVVISSEILQPQDPLPCFTASRISLHLGLLAEYILSKIIAKGQAHHS